MAEKGFAEGLKEGFKEGVEKVKEAGNKIVELDDKLRDPRTAMEAGKKVNDWLDNAKNKTVEFLDRFAKRNQPLSEKFTYKPIAGVAREAAEEAVGGALNRKEDERWSALEEEAKRYAESHKDEIPDWVDGWDSYLYHYVENIKPNLKMTRTVIKNDTPDPRMQEPLAKVEAPEQVIATPRITTEEFLDRLTRK